MSNPVPPAGVPTRGTGLADAGVIVAVVALSAVLYLPFLGFYSDDWSFLWYVQMGGPGTSVAEVYSRTLFLTDSILTRPVHALYAGTLLALFGDQPLGHHLVNTAVIALGAVLLYRILAALALGRPFALAVALTWALLPHYATVRYWFVCFQIPLSFACYAVALLADLRADREPPGARWRWRLASLAGVFASAMSYEIFMPLVLLNPVLVAWSRRPALAGLLKSVRGQLPFLGLQVAVLVGCGLFKAAFTARLPPAPVLEHVTWFAKLVRDAAGTAVLRDFGLGLPRVLGDIAVRHDGLVAAVAALVGLAVFTVLRRRLRAEPGALPSGREAGVLLAGAAAVFLGGYGIFVLTFNAGIATTGMSNRIGLAAAIGIALAAVTAFAWLGARLAERARATLFAALVAATCAAGTAVIDSLGLMWGEAALRQRDVLAAVRRALPEAPPGATLLLDGFCPWVGPAPVFETWWDSAGALRLLYGDSSLAADVVTPRLEVTDDGIVTTAWGHRRGPYAWRDLVLVDLQRGEALRFGGADEARAHFAARNPRLDSGCRPYREGSGEPVFVPGGPVARFPPVAGRLAP